jgi:hypothetical protein
MTSNSTAGIPLTNLRRSSQPGATHTRPQPTSSGTRTQTSSTSNTAQPASAQVTAIQTQTSSTPQSVQPPPLLSTTSQTQSVQGNTSPNATTPPWPRLNYILSVFTRPWLGNFVALFALILAIVVAVYPMMLGRWSAQNDALSNCLALEASGRPLTKYCLKRIGTGVKRPPFRATTLYTSCDLHWQHSSLLVQLEYWSFHGWIGDYCVGGLSGLLAVLAIEARARRGYSYLPLSMAKLSFSALSSIPGLHQVVQRERRKRRSQHPSTKWIYARDIIWPKMEIILVVLSPMFDYFIFAVPFMYLILYTQDGLAWLGQASIILTD